MDHAPFLKRCEVVYGAALKASSYAKYRAKSCANNFQSHNNLAVTWPKDYPSYPFYDWTIVYVSIITTSTYVFGNWEI